MESNSKIPEEDTSEQDTIIWLKLIARVNLIIGCIGFLVVFLIAINSDQGTGIGIGIALALLFEGIFGYYFLSVFCSIANNLIAIRKNTEK